MKTSDRKFEEYAAVWVKRRGPKEPIYVCQPDEFSGFWCGACGKGRVYEGARWRCKCGARVYAAVPRWYAEKYGARMPKVALPSQPPR